MINSQQEKKGFSSSKGRRLSARDSEAQTRRKKMGTFLQSLREVQPLIESAKKMALTHGDFRIQLARLFHQQRSIIKVLTDAWSISPEDLADAIVFAKISRASSRVLSLSHSDDPVDVSRVENIAKLLTVLNQERRELGELIQENTVSSDILVNVKIVLLSGAMRLQRILSGMGIDYSSSIEHLRWFHQATVILGKDIAFNWDKNSQFKDREVLFQEVVGFCSEMVIDSWLDAASKNIELDKNIMQYQNKQRYWSKFKDALIDNHMGHADHDDHSMDSLISSVSKILDGKLSLFNLSQIPDDKRMLFEIAIVAKIDELAVKSWASASQKIIDMVNSMTEEQFQEWKKTDGDKPMPIENFVSELDILMSEEKNFIKISKQQNIDAEKTSKQQLSVLWGLSDAVCRVKSTKTV